MINDTIAAVSTPKGKGGIATIRISGDNTAEILKKCFSPRGKAPWDCPRYASYGNILKGEEVVDSGLATFFEKGASFTGEESAEISCHGGIAVTAATLEAVFFAGAVPAEAGEFTRRAFINGKLSLTEAEAVGKLIDADTDARRRLASSAVQGRLRERTEGISSELKHVLAALYAAIDYPDEDIGDEGEREIINTIDTCLKELKKLLATYKTGCAVSEGVVCAIVGAPNCGKSSLYNLLCQSEKAIVTEIAGTTRDTLWETVECGGITLRIADTAGIRETEDMVESIGVSRALETMNSSELVIAVFDSSRQLAVAEKDLISQLEACPAAKIAVVNKSDLEKQLDFSAFGNSFDELVVMSCSTGEGFDSLQEAVQHIYNSEKLSLDSDALLWDSRHKAIVENAIELLETAKAGLEMGDAPDGACTLAEAALGEISMLDGRGVTEDIVSEIFARFCVGK